MIKKQKSYKLQRYELQLVLDALRSQGNLPDMHFIFSEECKKLYEKMRHYI